MDNEPHGGASSWGKPPLLLSAQDADPVIIINAKGRSPFLITGDHAGNRIPAALGTLGLPPNERIRHIAWDIGVMDVGTRLSEAMDATFVAQRYSRLVIDCNRSPWAPEAISAVSDGTAIPGNDNMDDDARLARIVQIHDAYHSAIAQTIIARTNLGLPTILLALHSFTPTMAGMQRPWHIGILHSEGRTDFARALLDTLARQPTLIIGDNEPYRMDATDYSVPRHAFASSIPYAEIEVRQDLICDEAGKRSWAALLALALDEAARSIG